MVVHQSERFFKTVKYTDMDGRIVRRLDCMIVDILLGTMSIRCRRDLNMKELCRLGNHALVAAIANNMSPGENMANRGLGRRVGTLTDAVKQRTVLTLRIQSETSPDKCFARNAVVDLDSVDSDDDAGVAVCSCFKVQLVLDEAGQGSAYCSCPSPEALLCKHIWCALFLEGGAACWGIARDSVRLDVDPDIEPGGDDSESDGPDEPAPRTISSLVEQVQSALVAPLERSDDYDRRTLSELVQHLDSKLANLNRPQTVALCSQFVYEIRERMRDLDTRVKVPARPGRASGHGFAARPTSGPRPTPELSVADASFRASQGTGRPPVSKSHIHPLVPQTELLSRFAVSSSSGGASGCPPVSSLAATAGVSAVTRRSRLAQLSAPDAAATTLSTAAMSSSSSSVSPPRVTSKRADAPSSPDADGARTGAAQERDSKKARQPKKSESSRR